MLFLLSAFLLHAAELNQRALVGKEALVNPGADQTADDAINKTRRYYNEVSSQLMAMLPESWAAF